MFLHEFQAKELLASQGVSAPFFEMAFSFEEGLSLFNKIPSKKKVLKAQVHAGGRKKGGGVLIVEGESSFKKALKTLFETSFSGHQTGGRELVVNKVMVTTFVNLLKEFYLSLAFDRREKGVFFTFSKEGGVDIEEKGKTFLTFKTPLNHQLEEYQIRDVLSFLELSSEPKIVIGLSQFLNGVLKTFYTYDAEMIEINPLGLDDEGNFLAIDAKMTVDDAALFRQKRVASFFDPSQEEEKVIKAKNLDLSFVPLKGEVGCLVNGAGLALATLDLVEEAGLKAANFLDVGGGASPEKISEGFLMSIDEVGLKCLFVNIFGGIMNCKTLSEGLLIGKKKWEQLHKSPFSLPVVLRMEGTLVQEGIALLKEASFPYFFVKDLKEAFEFFVKMEKEENI